MPSYGVTPEGFVRPSVQELLDLTNGEQRATISQGLDQSPEGILGQKNAIHARQLGLAWETLETAYNGFDPDSAEDFLLTALAKLTGTRREGATASRVAVSVNLDDGTTLLAGEHFAHIEGKPGVRFTPEVNFTAVGDDDYDLTFVSETLGPIVADTGTLTVIATSVIGWNSIENTEDAVLGQVTDTDLTLRTKREAQLAAAGSQTAKAIRSDLLQLGGWVKSVTVIENESAVTDGNGLPPHSFEVLVHDSGAPAESDDLIAQAIWNNKPSGIQSYGDASDSGTAITETGATVVVPFSRVTEVPIYITMVLTTDPGFSDFAGVKSYVAAQANAKYTTAGADVIALFVKGLPIAVTGVQDVPTFFIGSSPAPAGTSNVSISLRELARFDTANIGVT